MTVLRTVRASTALFSLGAVSILLIAITAVRTALFAMHPDVLAWGLTFDLTLTIPLLHYLLVVRPGYARASSTAIVFIVCWMIATRIIPSSQHDFLRDLGAITFALEAMLVILVIRRVVALRREPLQGDVVARIERASIAFFSESRVAKIVASEISIRFSKTRPISSCCENPS